ncbi:MAG: HAD family hydrolase [Betaproteobacteria bacterium]|nr:HAD family hydrolase [Betaproteobacteria bacterium]MCC7218186.1 HAD family hydrolase [Burkholderiales bacterium]
MIHDILALFDLDRTLLPHDTDEQWTAFLLEHGKLDRAAFDAANRDLAARYTRGEAGALEFAEFYLSTLTALDPVELAALHDVFMRERVLPSIPVAARDLIAKHRRLGHFMVLTTATSRFMTAPVARELGFENHIATEPEMRDGRYTGRVAGTPNMREGKVERLLDWLADRGMRLSDFRESWFYSDSQNDLPLLSHVTHPVAVNADPVLAAHARHKGWPQITIG